MYGKIYDSMFTGSLYGSGAITFAVWSYVIANMQPSREGLFYLEINPRLLARLLGEDEKDVVTTLDKFCAPDAESRSSEEEGRRLVKEGQYLYRVVNGPKYREMRDEDARRQYMRDYMRERRKEKREEPARRKAVEKLMRPGGARTMEERLIEKAEREGDDKTLAALERMRQLSPTEKRVKATADEFVKKFQQSMEAANAALAAASPEASPVDPSALRADFDGEVRAASHHVGTLDSDKESLSGDGTVPAEGAEGQSFPEV